MSNLADIVELEEERSKRSSKSSEALESAGAMLAAAREEAGFDLDSVSEATNIRTVHLDSIEKMQIERLPVAAYTTGFVKAYAEFLDLPAEALVERFRKEAGYGNRPAIAPEVQMPQRRELAGGRELSLLAVILILGFVLWVAFQITRPQSPEGPVNLPETPLKDRPAELAVTAPAEEAIVSAVTSPTETVEEAKTDMALASEPAGGIAPAAETAPIAGTEAGGEDVPSVETASGETAAVESALGESESGEAEVAAENTLTEIAESLPVETDIVTETPALDIAESDIAEPAADLSAASDAESTPLLADPVQLDPLPAETASAAPVETGPVAEEAAEASLPVDLEEGLNDLLAAPVEEAEVAPAIVEAVLRNPVAPSYPYRCQRRAGDVEQVIVGYDISANGRVMNARIVSSTNGCFDGAALSAVNRWQFDPQTVDGAPRAVFGRTNSFRFEIPE